MLKKKERVDTAKDEKKTQQQEIKMQKQMARVEAKAFAQRLREQRKKDSAEAQAIKRGAALAAARLLLWLILGFVFLRGVQACLRPDAAREVNESIAAFKAELSSVQTQDVEVLAFAQNFATEYLTYAAGAEQDYINRIGKYASKTVTGQTVRFAAGSGASVIYAQAYRKEMYSASQVDVWVLVNVQYYSKQQGEGGTVKEQNIEESAILRIPISVKGNTYIVEDLPAFVSDSNKQTNYAITAFRGGGECPKEISDAISASLQNFFKAYYEADQSVISYYLTPSADTTKFQGLCGRLQFERIAAMKAYYLSATEKGRFVAIVTVQAKDKNGTSLQQSYHLQLVLRDNQYYVQDIGTRSFNLNILEEK